MSYNKNHGIVYRTDDDIFDNEDFNRNYSTLADSIDSVNEEIMSSKEDITSLSNQSKEITGVITQLNNSIKLLMSHKQNKTEYLVCSDTSDDIYIGCADYEIECFGEFVSADEFNSFLSSLPSGSRVIFAPGKYMFSTSIIVPSNITLEGLNHSARIATNEDINLLKIEQNANNIIIKNLYFIKANVNGELEESTENEIRHVLPMISVNGINGLYIEQCGLRYRNSWYDEDEGYNSIIELRGKAENCIIEKCVLNTDIQLSLNGNVVGYVVSCFTTSLSIKMLNNFGNATIYMANTNVTECTLTGNSTQHKYNSSGEIKQEVQSE